jgi:AmmeMemoRadiSam system protein A
MSNEEHFSQEEQKKILAFILGIIKSKLENTIRPSLPDMGDKLSRQGSCFVTLHASNGALRGCIGNINAFEPLGINIARNALNSAFGDPRFHPLDNDEIDEVHIEVSILTPAAEIPSYEDFIVGKHGIIISSHGRSAVFLPQVAPEQGWDRATTLSHLCMKAGLNPDAWTTPDAKFSVFEAIVFSEEKSNEQFD